MKFFSRRPSMSVIDKISRQKICSFNKDSVFETDDPYLIKKLKPYFRHEENKVENKVEKKESKVKAKVLGYWELKAKAKKMGIKTHNMKKPELVEALKGE